MWLSEAGAALFQARGPAITPGLWAWLPTRRPIFGRLLIRMCQELTESPGDACCGDEKLLQGLRARADERWHLLHYSAPGTGEGRQRSQTPRNASDLEREGLCIKVHPGSPARRRTFSKSWRRQNSPGP